MTEETRPNPKVLGTSMLIAANKTAIKLNQNRTLDPKKLVKLADPDGVHVVGFTMDHTNWEGTPGVRCQIFVKVKDSMEPLECWLDVRHEDFLGWPNANDVIEPVEA